MQEELDHARKEIEKRAGALDDEAGADDSDPEKASRPSNLQLEINLTLEIGQVRSNLSTSTNLHASLSFGAFDAS